MKILDERGYTLTELLVTLTISAIIIPIVYGVFTSGYSLYNKIQIEGQLRDDADYTATMIMNTLYSYPFDYVRNCGENCIELVDATYTELSKFEGENQTFYSFNQKENYDVEKSQKIELKEKVFSINGQPLNVMSNFQNSTLEFTCSNEEQIGSSKCENAIISLNFKLTHDRIDKTLELQSQFGF